MQEASAFEGEQSLSHPEDQVYAIFDDVNKGRAAVTALNRQGIEPEKIGFLVGDQGSAKLDAATGKAGFLSRVAHMGLEMGDRDADYLSQYQKALSEGCAVIAVVVRDRNHKLEIRDLLKAYGARAITYFGQLSTEVWEA
jgi:hypothetical protein